ncbi:HAD family hydrolase [Ilumatobacter sp.]|uniref:HAD family hydrolase n=1 Tax=Ilumatobacter sp. TaxID=1967498 RepID=UPI00375049C8
MSGNAPAARTILRRPVAVVFDFGGVLITSITKQIGMVAATHDVAASVMHELLLGPRESGMHPWHRAERGEIAIADIQGLLEPWAATAGVQLHGDEIGRLLAAGEYTVVDEMVARVGTLRDNGHRTALLTNTFAEFRPTMERDIDLTMFDAVIESFAVGARKPEPAIYEATAAMLGVDHEAIVYLDDFEQNLEVPKMLGWRTILVADPLVALAALDATVSV